MAKSGPAAQPKRPRRKYRRRPSRLLEEYKKRSSKVSWLETHLWHAKRLGLMCCLCQGGISICFYHLGFT